MEPFALVEAPTDELCAEARAVREQGTGSLVTYSPKVFIPLTKLCRDVCHYCTFARPPRRGERAYMSIDEVLAVARAGAAAGCHEALFTLGDKPELRYRAAREELARLGCATTLEYLEQAARAVLEETGLLPHVNPGVMDASDLARLRTVSASQGIMLESSAERLSARGGPHFGSPDKLPARRLETLRLAGEAAVPFTTGILIGIGETRAERIESLLAIRELGERYGHVQEVIVQNFRAKPGTRMAGHPEPSLDELLWTAAAARVLLGPAWNIQAPPNLSYDEFPRLLDAGINDWGGVSPVTVDHVNPEAPWPEVERLRAATEAHGLRLAPRLPIYPEYVADLSRWADPAVATAVLRRADADGLAREDRWAAGSAESPASPLGRPRAPARGPPASSPLRAYPGNPHAWVSEVRRNRHRRIAEALAKARAEDELDEDDVTTLLRARGPDVHAVLHAADRLRREVNGDTVTYVVTRNINYTNVCYFRCGFCAFSKGKLAENLRGRPYLVPLDEIVRRSREAWERGAVEVCLQGGIHPAFTGDFYLDVCRAIKDELPDIHVHAFSALEVWQGAATLRVTLGGVPGAAPRRRARLAARDGRRDPGRRRAARDLPGQGLDAAVAPGARRGAPGRAALHDHDHVRPRRHHAELGPPPHPPARAAEAHRRLHRVRPPPLRPHGGADLPEGKGAARARPSARRCSSTPSAASPCIPGSRTSRPPGSSSGWKAPRRPSGPARTTSAAR